MSRPIFARRARLSPPQDAPAPADNCDHSKILSMPFIPEYEIPIPEGSDIPNAYVKDTYLHMLIPTIGLSSVLRYAPGSLKFSIAIQRPVYSPLHQLLNRAIESVDIHSLWGPLAVGLPFDDHPLPVIFSPRGAAKAEWVRNDRKGVGFSDHRDGGAKGVRTRGGGNLGPERLRKHGEKRERATRAAV
jgi:hypothetical protein